MNITVFCGASLPPREAFVKAAELLGKLIADGGHTLLYGGSNLGLMGIVSGAALAQGGKVVGVIPSFFSDEVILSQPVTKLVRVASMAERKEYLISHSDALIALPGGIGTLDEVFEVLVSNQLGLRSCPMGLLNTCRFFDPLLAQLQLMEAEGFYHYSAAGYLICDPSPESLLHHLASYAPSNYPSPLSDRLRHKA